MKSTNPITYLYEIDGREVAVTRRHVGTAYPKNGNVGNPTVYFVWETHVDGKYVMGASQQRAEAYEYGRAFVIGIIYIPYREHGPRCQNVRPYTLVADEMKANYKGRRKVPA